MAHADVERERTRELARSGENLNQIARGGRLPPRGAGREGVEILQGDPHQVAALAFEHKCTSG